MKYSLEVGQIVYFKCKIIKIDEANCSIRIEGANCGEQNIRFEVHPNSLMHSSKKIKRSRRRLTSFIRKIICLILKN